MAEEYGDKWEKQKGKDDRKVRPLQMKHYIIGGVFVLLFAAFIYPGSYSYLLSTGMGSIHPGCVKCEGQKIACNVASDCPVTVDEVFYGEPITLSAPRCELGECGYDQAIKYRSGAIACNFINCITLQCKDQCNWEGCSGDYRCYDQNGDLCKERVWSDVCNLPNPRYEGIQGRILNVELPEGNTVLEGQPFTVTVVFQADVEGLYLIGGGIVYPEPAPAFAVLPANILVNHCNPQDYWYGSEEVHLYPGVQTVNFTVYSKNNMLGVFNVEGVWMKDCSRGSINPIGYDQSTVYQKTTVNVVKQAPMKALYRVI